MDGRTAFEWSGRTEPDFSGGLIPNHCISDATISPIAIHSPTVLRPSLLFSCQSCVSRLVGDLSVVINHQTSVSHLKNHC